MTAEIIIAIAMWCAPYNHVDSTNTTITMKKRMDKIQFCRDQMVSCLEQKKNIEQCARAERLK